MAGFVDYLRMAMGWWSGSTVVRLPKFPGVATFTRPHASTGYFRRPRESTGTFTRPD